MARQLVPHVGEQVGLTPRDDGSHTARITLGDVFLDLHQLPLDYARPVDELDIFAALKVGFNTHSGERLFDIGPLRSELAIGRSMLLESAYATDELRGKVFPALDDHIASVSRIHCVLRAPVLGEYDILKPYIEVTDLGSKNGTFIE